MAGKMVLDATLSTIMQNLYDRLILFLSRRLGWLSDERPKFESLSSGLMRVRALIHEAERAPVGDVAAQSWLSEIRGFADDIEDLMDSMAELEESSHRGSHGHYVMEFVQVKNLKKIILYPDHLKDMLNKLENIEGEAQNRYLNRVGSSLSREPNKRRFAEFDTSSLVEASSIRGRDNDKRQIIDILVPKVLDSEDVEVVLIEGMAGVGKTTLAQLVYNDKQVFEHFGTRAWVCVSQSFEVPHITKAIVESITRESCPLLNIDPLQRRLQDLLHDKRFLIVLDNVWNENRALWERLKLPFVFGRRGSKILVTTRSHRVSSIMRSVGREPYPLKCLSDEESWNLFAKEVFGDIDSAGDYPDLIYIGQEIVKKCSGLPLAVKSLAGCVRSERDSYKWNSVLLQITDTCNLAANDVHKDILNVLKVSYDVLSPQLRLCFSYCSVFPKGYEFDKDELVLLWIAQGFVYRDLQCDPRYLKNLEKVPRHSICRSPRVVERSEALGSEIFDDLLSRCLFQESKTTKFKYRMHDLNHDLAIHVLGERCIRLHGNSNHENFSAEARYASIMRVGIDDDTINTIYKCKRLQTLLFFARNDIVDISRSDCIERGLGLLFHQLKFLHVLDLSVTGIRQLPDAVGELRSLRYLDLSWTHIGSLPARIGALHLLQILKLNGCSELLQLPAAIAKLTNLRHLSMEGGSNLKAMPIGMGCLTQLQTLSKFVLRQQTPCGISELGRMRNLRGNLSISQLENVENVQEAEDARLKYKWRLQRLELQWTQSTDQRLMLDEAVMEALQPQQALEHLVIYNYIGRKHPTWLSSLSHLQSIYLYNCRRFEFSQSLLHLSSLKNLVVIGLHEVEVLVNGQNLGQDGSFVELFPSLQTLILKDMPKLGKLTNEGKCIFPCLDELEIVNCPRLVELPYLPAALKKLQICNCERLTAFDLQLPSLQYLALDRCSELNLRSFTCLTSLSSLSLANILLSTNHLDWLQSLTALKKLEIRHAHELVSLFNEGSLHSLISLQDMVIINCPKLKILSDQQGLPRSLLTLEISSCPKVKHLPGGLENLSLLESLIVDNCQGLESMAEEKLPAMLKELRISACHNLEMLPTELHNLTSLQELKLWDCPKLHSLPEQLPRTIEYFLMKDCPLLKNGCCRGEGSEWPKIEHIPRICINEEWISLG